ncbi:MAG: lysophospholipid acyltransferase family protein [bacterium]|jgi:1-acyl-sn-glycerol-3-phosphate acyltransferase
MRFHYRMARVFLNFLAWLLFGMVTRGGERVPAKGGVIIASNHISYFDPPVVGCGIPRELHFMAKEELFKNPVFAAIIRSYNAIPLKRSVGDMAALRKAVKLIRQGRAVLMFPEGTRSLSGKLLKAKAGVGMIGVMTSAPIVPVHVEGTNSLSKAFWRKRRFMVSCAEPVIPSDYKDENADPKEQYQRVTDEVMKRIAGLAEENQEAR